MLLINKLLKIKWLLKLHKKLIQIYQLIINFVLANRGKMFSLLLYNLQELCICLKKLEFLLIILWILLFILRGIVYLKLINAKVELLLLYIDLFKLEGLIVKLSKWGKVIISWNLCIMDLFIFKSKPIVVL